MPRPSQSDKILQAALHCFATYGYDATRIKHIAEAAKVSEGALYRHYPSKEAVAQALFVHHLRIYVEQWQQTIAHAPFVEAQLRGIVRDTLAAYQNDPDGVAFVLLGPPLMDTISQDIPFPITLIAQVMRHGQQAGVVRAGSPLLLAAIFLGSILRPIIVERSGLHDQEEGLLSTAGSQLIADAAWAAVSQPGQ